MKMNSLALFAATMMTPAMAQAITVLGTYDATPSISVYTGVGSTSLWFETIMAPGLDRKYVLSSPGTFEADDTGATLVGSTGNVNDDTAGFSISFVYDRDFSNNTDPTPEFKAVFGGVTEHGNEEYFDMESGTVTGTGGFEGLNFDVVRAPPSGEFATQVGGGLTGEVGANQHNSNFGISGWFEISGYTLDLSTCVLCTTDTSFYEGLVGTQGDINMDLTLASAPIPAAGLLLFGALFGVGAVARRRKS